LKRTGQARENQDCFAGITHQLNVIHERAAVLLEQTGHDTDPDLSEALRNLEQTLQAIADDIPLLPQES
jgi:hypothetical protein